MRLPAPQAALRPVYTGDGGADCRLLRGEVSGDGRHHLLDRSGRSGRHHHVCSRVDHAHRRQPDHPHRGDPAAAVGQYRATWRRHQRAPRACQRAGCHRPCHRRRYPARLPEGAYAGADHAGRASRGVDTATARAGHGELLGQLSQVSGVAAQGLVWRQRHGGQRVRVSLSRQAGRRRHLAVDLGRGLPRAARGVHHARVQPAAGRSGHPAAAQVDVAPEVDDGHRPVHAR